MVWSLRLGQCVAAWVCVVALLAMLGFGCGVAACGGHAAMNGHSAMRGHAGMTGHVAVCSRCCPHEATRAASAGCCAAGVLPAQDAAGSAGEPAMLAAGGFGGARVDVVKTAGKVGRVGALFSPPPLRAVLRI